MAETLVVVEALLVECWVAVLTFNCRGTTILLFVFCFVHE